MSNLREAVAVSFDANLDAGPHERPVDRIAALGKSDPLGAAFYHYAYGKQRDSRKHVLVSLYKRSGAPRGSWMPIWVRLCEMALHELENTSCRVCKGAGEIKTKEKVIVCRDCNGSQVQYYSDRARAIFMGLTLDQWYKWQKKFLKIQEILTDAERRVNVKLNIELDRLTIVK